MKKKKNNPYLDYFNFKFKEMKKKQKWFQQWLDRDGYTLWYEYKDNEVFKNDDKVLVWHPSLGLRFMFPLDYFPQEYLVKTFIPVELLKQEV